MNLCVVGRTLCFMHQYDEAIAYLEQAIRINPKDDQAYFNRGLVKKKKGDISGGEADLAKAKALRGER